MSTRAIDVVAESQEVLRRHARSFRWGSLFLGRREQADAAVVYAFCRAVDDAVDTAPSARVGRGCLDELEDMLEGRRAPSPLVEAYREVAGRQGFGLEPARDLLRGARSDLGLVRLESDEELQLYCYRVAGTVGLMMCGVLGVEDAAARRHAVELGVAMQLTNICRDVLEDARMGRVYLPRRRLVDAGASPDELLLTPGSEPSAQLRRGVTRVVGELLAEAEQSYRQGQAGFRYLPVRARLAVGVAAQLYRAIGRRLLGAHGGDPLHGRTVVPAWQKLLFTLRATAEWLASALGRRVQPSDSAAATASLGS